MSTPANYAGWTIPNIQGKFSPGKNYTAAEGVFTEVYDRSGEDGSNGNGYRLTFDLNNISVFKGHLGSRIEPNHYKCKWYIKYK